MNKKVKLVPLSGGKEGEVVEIPSDKPVLILDGEIFILESFIIAGTMKTEPENERERFGFAYNATIDEQVVYNNSLRIQIDDHYREKFRK